MYDSVNVRETLVGADSVGQKSCFRAVSLKQNFIGITEVVKPAFSIFILSTYPSENVSKVVNKFDVIKDSAFSTRHSTEVTFNFLVRSYDSTRIVLLEILSILFCQHTSQISYLKREFV